MPEQVEAWWARRQWSKQTDKPYSVGQYREQWQQYPVLVRQFHPDLNGGVTLSQIPPAADVWLLWQCDVGHQFVATPWEQRQKPGRSRRRSTWCPECATGAVIKTPKPAKPFEERKRKPPKPLCARSDASRRELGEAFASACTPARASAAEADLQFRLAERLDYTADATAVRLARPFFDHIEAWPDIIIPELRVAIEYDTTGRDGLEHVGKREPVDRRKDRALRAVGWEVIRVRTGKLLPLGPHDIQAGSISNKLIDRLLDELRDARGHLFVDCYLR